jgi:tetratricopeptide (TPR) repeat protein
VVDSIAASLDQNPQYANELKNFGLSDSYPVPGWLQSHSGSFGIMPHYSTDLAFSTDYAASYPKNFGALNAFSYQARGDLALQSEYYTQALEDFGNAIRLDPTNPILYLERGIANFELGNYEQSINDYNQFVEKKSEPFSVSEFSLSFAQGVRKGSYDSGKGSLLFLSEFIAHPIHTSKQVVDSIWQLVHKEAPEAHIPIREYIFIGE